jgi:hypothetical protein
MGRRDHVLDAILSRNPGHFDSFFDRTGTIVDLGKDVGMNIDHGKQG